MKEASNKNLQHAKEGKKDEFYTMRQDIDKEMRTYLDKDPDFFRGKVVLCPCDNWNISQFVAFFTDNFSRLGLSRFVATSYACGGRGKIYEISSDGNFSTGELIGDGDFASDEVSALRDSSDVIVTNPPFSLFRAFVAWIFAAPRPLSFSIVGNLNSVSYRDVFPLLKNNEMWLGTSIYGGDTEFAVPSDYPLKSYTFRVGDNGGKFINVKGIRWFTNIEASRRGRVLNMRTMEANKAHNFRVKKAPHSYKFFDGLEAVEVPSVTAIPTDCSDVMGVPITFFDYFDPDIFEIIGMNKSSAWPDRFANYPKRKTYLDGKETYVRIFIRLKHPACSPSVLVNS